MDEVQYNVSHMGVHLFRTDWYDQGLDQEAVKEALQKKFVREEGFKILETRRTKLMKSQDVTQ